MKIIHCADVHLDSKLNFLDHEKAKVRNAELQRTFREMVEYGQEKGVSAVLIAGDLFDTAKTSATTVNFLTALMKEHPEIAFYYLRGNHDSVNGLAEDGVKPDNLFLFEDSWKTYYRGDLGEGKVAITGVELSKKNSETVWNSLFLDRRNFNIVMLHGQETEGNAKDRGEYIPLKSLKNQGIRYLALGHIHGYKEEKLDSTGVYCYSGCPEGRGFDECGEHGFVVLTVDENTGEFTREFVKTGKRKLYAPSVDISGCDTTAEIYDRIRTLCREEGCTAEDLLKVILTGEVDVACEKDLLYLETQFKDRFFYFKIEDKSRLRIRIEDYLTDRTLKGEFVRNVFGDESLSEDEKVHVIRYGLQAIAGEDVGEEDLRKKKDV